MKILTLWSPLLQKKKKKKILTLNIWLLTKLFVQVRKIFMLLERKFYDCINEKYTQLWSK